jgi:hypothetical protein
LFFNHQVWTSFYRETCPDHHSLAHVEEARELAPVGIPRSVRRDT